MFSEKMAKDMKVLLYCTLSFILGCTFTVSVIKFDYCAEENVDVIDESVKLPRDNYNFLSKEILNPSVKNSRKSILAFLFILVMSSPDNTEQRNAIRETWATYNEHHDVQHFFFVGTKNLTDYQSLALVKEYENHKDLVLLAEAADSYEALTSKVLMAFTWLANIADFSFALKCDDDTFVRVPLLVKELKALERNRTNVSPRRLYWGFFDGRAHVRRSGRWAESNWVICDRYLPYALGGGYVLSKDLVTILADRAPLLELYKSEDVAVGVWLSSVKGLERKHDPRFDTEYLSRGCKESYIVTHKSTPSSMRTSFNSIRVSGKLCPSGEFRTRLSYMYNWDVLPSHCCSRTDPSVP